MISDATSQWETDENGQNIIVKKRKAYMSKEVQTSALIKLRLLKSVDTHHLYKRLLR